VTYLMSITSSNKYDFFYMYSYIRNKYCICTVTSYTLGVCLSRVSGMKKNSVQFNFTYISSED
jgi:hypothetical protein